MKTPPTLGSLFTGTAALDHAVCDVIGCVPVWFCDNDRDAATLLAHHYPHTPNLGDITAVDWSTVEPVDILTGGFPCQDVSLAGRRVGIGPDTRSGLWSHMAYAIAAIRPRLVVAENVRGLLSARAHSHLEPCPGCLGNTKEKPALRALGAVLGDLADLGYDAVWCGLRASDVGAPHARFRVFLVAQDADRPACDEWWQSAPGQAKGWRSRSDLGGRSGAPFADPGRDTRPTYDADINSVARHRGPITDTERCGDDHRWGAYAPAIRRWEALLGRTAPAPTVIAPRGGRVLSTKFVEWMMGLPSGYITEVPSLSRTAMLKLGGNGVVPRQAAAAIRRLLPLTSTAVAA